MQSAKLPGNMFVAVLGIPRHASHCATLRDIACCGVSYYSIDSVVNLRMRYEKMLIRQLARGVVEISVRN